MGVYGGDSTQLPKLVVTYSSLKSIEKRKLADRYFNLKASLSDTLLNIHRQTNHPGDEDMNFANSTKLVVKHSLTNITKIEFFNETRNIQNPLVHLLAQNKKCFSRKYLRKVFYDEPEQNKLTKSTLLLDLVKCIQFKSETQSPATYENQIKIFDSIETSLNNLSSGSDDSMDNESTNTDKKSDNQQPLSVSNLPVFNINSQRYDYTLDSNSEITLIDIQNHVHNKHINNKLHQQQQNKDFIITINQSNTKLNKKLTCKNNNNNNNIIDEDNYLSNNFELNNKTNFKLSKFYVPLYVVTLIGTLSVLISIVIISTIL